MPGFQFRYRRGGGDPTVRVVTSTGAGTLTRGDLLTSGGAGVALGVAGDTTLLGASLDTVDGALGATSLRVVVDADAVYGVHDPHARRAGDVLDLAGGTGAQGVATSTGSELVVEIDCAADEETLVSIAVRAYRALDPGAARRGPAGSELNAALARAVTRFYRQHTGRGPTKAKAFYRDDVVVVVLENTMTTGERSLVARGREDAVLRLRRAFQEAMREQMVAQVEELTAAKVRAHLSANHIAPDIAVETFVLDRPVRGGDDA